MYCYVYISLTFVLLLQSVSSRPDGAPKTACTTLRPGHAGASSLSGDNPFVIKVENLTNGQLNVTLTSTNNSHFRGFILQAREVGTQIPVGKFTQLPNDAKTINCTNPEDTATHVNRTIKYNLTFTWAPPENFTGNIKFFATVVIKFDQYWFNFTSEQITFPLSPTPTTMDTQSPSVTTQPPMVNMSPSMTTQPPMVNMSPSVTTQPLLVNMSPSMTTQPPIVNMSPSVTTQPPLVNMSPSMNTQPPMVNMTPSATTQPPMVNMSPSMTTQPPMVNMSPSMTTQPPMVNMSPSMTTQPPMVNMSPSVATQPPMVNMSATMTTRPPMVNISATVTTISKSSIRTNSTILQPSTTQAPKTTAPSKATTMRAEIGINRNFDNKLLDPTSKEFRDLANELKQQIQNVYEQKELAVEVTVTGFRAGSIIAEFIATFLTNVADPLSVLSAAIEDNKLGNFTIVAGSLKRRDKCTSESCDKNADCTEGTNSIKCVCKPGFTGDGTQCTADEKVEDNKDIKDILIAALVLIVIIFLIVLFFLLILVRRMNGDE